jgi:hypothetical protein
MRSRKQSDSPSGYDREVRPRGIFDAIVHQERNVRRLADERWERKVQALMPSAADRPSDDWPGCVE